MARRTNGDRSGQLRKQKKAPYSVAKDVPPHADGKRRRLTATGRTLKEAKARLAVKLEEVARDQMAAATPNAGVPTRTYLERWMRHRRPSLSPRTIELYQHQLDRHVLPHIGDIPLAELRPIHIVAMIDAIVATGHKATANKCRTMLFSALKQAVRWEMIDKNPVEATDAVKEDRKERSLWTTDQALQFIDHNRQHRLFAAFYLLLVSGVRRGELLGLRWIDVTSEGINIRQTVTSLGNKAVIGQTKTHASTRFVAIPQDALAVLEAHRQRQDAAKAIAGAAWSHPELVFPSGEGTPMHPRNLGRDWTKAVKQAGVPHARIHDIRHLHITLSILRGDDPKLISDRAGHSSTSFTLDRYGHVFREHRQRGARSLDDLLGNTGTPTTSEPDRGVDDPVGAEEAGGANGDA